jgi:Putative regulator of cell autolysis
MSSNIFKNYVVIQQIRFEDQFEVFYDIPDNLHKCKFLNSSSSLLSKCSLPWIRGKRDKGSLEISACKEGKNLKLRVQDDGVGMSEEQLIHLNEYIEKIDKNVLKSYKGSIGIKNVNSRIKLTYGEKFGISVLSQQHTGTQVTVTLPVYGYQGGEDDVQDTDR